MNIILEAQNILEINKYLVKKIDIGNIALVFEDDFIIGTVIEYDSINSMIENWEKDQDKFLVTYEGSFRKAPEKVWNAYTVLFTSESLKKDFTDKILLIEEDLRGTRKIVMTGVISAIDIEKALMPILPIQKKVNITKEDYHKRLRERIEIAEIFEYENIGELYRAIENKT